MKNLIIAILCLLVISTISSLSRASGFVCQGQGYSVKLYNHVKPSRGTKNPAVLVVATEASGLVVKLLAHEIEKILTERAITYRGQTQDPVSGRFVSVRLDVVRSTSRTSGYEGAHFARLVIKSDKTASTANLACATYLKGQK